MGRYKNAGIGVGIGTSPQTALENNEYENKVHALEGKLKSSTVENKKDNLNNLANKEMSTKGKELLEKAENEKVKNVIKELYRAGAEIGDGGTADAIRHELATDKLVGGKSHVKKGKERLKNLENILKKRNLQDSDKQIVKELYDDLKDALKGVKNDK